MREEEEYVKEVERVCKKLGIEVKVEE